MKEILKLNPDFFWDINMKKMTSEEHFDRIAINYDFYKNKNSFYHKNSETLLGSLIPNPDCDKKLKW